MKGTHVRYVDEFSRDKLIAFVDDSGIAVIIERDPMALKSEEGVSKNHVTDFNINKYEKISMFHISKIPLLPHYYLIKHKNGIKLIDAYLRKWYDLTYEH